MFNNARISLTAFYLIAIVSVSLIFSAVIYRVVTYELYSLEKSQRSRIERRFQDNKYYINGSNENSLFPLPVNTELLKDTSQRVLFRLILINASIFVVSAVIGYMLAGRTLKPIQDMVDEQNRFITDASHELRTPLTSLRSGFEVFLRTKKPTLPEAKTLAKESLIEIGKLQKLSDSLLKLSKFEINNTQTSFKEVRLDEVIRASVKHVLPIAKQKSQSITADIPKITIKGDFEQLTDMFVIILDNAIKYSPSKSKISVTLYKKGKEAIVSIKDEGEGIAKKDLPHIFDRFYRSDLSRTKSKTSGYGLGLSIAKTIASKHHASIKVKSEPGKGSVFTIHLPIL